MWRMRGRKGNWSGGGGHSRSEKRGVRRKSEVEEVRSQNKTNSQKHIRRVAAFADFELFAAYKPRGGQMVVARKPPSTRRMAPVTKEEARGAAR